MLKDIEIKSDDDYFAYPAISASQIKTYDKSPYEFWRTSPFNPEKQPDAETDALVFGGLTHCLLLEPKEAQNRYVIADFGQSRRNKKYEAINAETQVKLLSIRTSGITQRLCSRISVPTQKSKRL